MVRTKLICTVIEHLNLKYKSVNLLLILIFSRLFYLFMC